MPEDNTLQVSCPSCGEVYVLTSDLIGQEAECESCGNIFVIEDRTATQKIPIREKKAPVPPADEDAPASDDIMEKAFRPAKEKEGNKESDTSTVKIPRMSGAGTMVPRVQDQFDLDVVHSQTNASSNRMTRRSISTPPKQKKKGWWEFWK